MSRVTELAKALSRYRTSPLLFVTECLKAEPEPWQREALKALATNDRVAVRSGHGVGKTAFQCWSILWYVLFWYPCKVPVTANSQDQLRDVVWAELQLWARRLPPYLRDQVEITSERVQLKAAPAEAFAVARTASRDRPEALQGFHAEHLLFVIEEASGIEEIVYQVAHGALSTPGAKIVMCGNPTRTEGFFHRAFHADRERWYTMRVSSEDVPRAMGHVEEVAAAYGRDSNVYRVRVLGDFPRADDDTVIPLELAEEATIRLVEPTGPAVWGLDVARFGDDRTALACRVGNVMPWAVETWRGKDVMQVAGLVCQKWDKTPEKARPHVINVDVIGLGAGVVDRLKELGLPARGVNVAESASVQGEYQRLRDELWFKAREWFQSRDCRLAHDPALIGELTTVRYDVLSTGKIKVEGKDDMKKRALRSPDIADAFILTFAGIAGRRPHRKKVEYPRTHISANII